MATLLWKRGAVAVALALAAGCSGGSAPFTPAQNSSSMALAGPQGWPVQATNKPILFVADLIGNVVRMYDPNTPNPMAEGTITKGISGPQGLAVDAKGSLYVSNVGTSQSWISIYSQGKSSPRMMIPGPGYYGLAVDSKGDIFATEVAGTVSAYKPGAKKPYEVIGGFVNPDGIAIDSKDNVWVADDTANTISIIPAGTKSVKNSGLKRLNGPVGIAFGHHDTLYVANTNVTEVDVYPVGSKVPSLTIKDGIAVATLNGVTAADTFFQSNQEMNVVGYKEGTKKPFSTIVGNGDPLGIAAWPLVKK